MAYGVLLAKLLSLALAGDELDLLTLRSTAPRVSDRELHGRIHFLFLARRNIYNWPIWKAYFSEANENEYRLFAHCSAPCELDKSVTLVETVNGEYCTNLVEPMIQLLRTALNGSGSQDKFLFASENALPVKPFGYTYRTLLARQSSDLCLMPPEQWRIVDWKIHVKAAQWITLQQRDGERAVEVWDAQGLGDPDSDGCKDEWWFTAALLGYPEVRAVGARSDFYNSLHEQARCNTFAIWFRQEDLLPPDTPQVQLMSSLDAMSQPSPTLSELDTHARFFRRLSSQGIRALRNSTFLFARKFTQGPQLVDGSSTFAEAFPRIVFS